MARKTKKEILLEEKIKTNFFLKSLWVQAFIISFIFILFIIWCLWGLFFKVAINSFLAINYISIFYALLQILLFLITIIVFIVISFVFVSGITFCYIMIKKAFQVRTYDELKQSLKSVSFENKYIQIFFNSTQKETQINEKQKQSKNINKRTQQKKVKEDPNNENKGKQTSKTNSNK